MANATISGITGTQAGNFTVDITFEVAIHNLTTANIQLLAVSGNGITGITFEILPDTDMDSSTYHVSFELPEDVEGELSITIIGMVTREGFSTPEAVMSNTLNVVYDNITTVSATFGTVEYRDGGIVVVPITFAENLIAPSKTIFSFANPASDAGDGIAAIADFYLIGEAAAYELVIQIAADRSGRFVVSTDGYVLKASSEIWDNVVVNAPAVVAYDTRVPVIENFDIPADFTPLAFFDVRIAFNTVVTGWHVNNTLTEIFIEEGARLGGGELPYKWVGSSPPDFTAAVPDDLSGTDWQLLATPPAGNPTPGSNGFDANGQWHGESGQYFLIRWRVDERTEGTFNLTLRQKAVRGPVS